MLSQSPALPQTGVHLEDSPEIERICGAGIPYHLKLPLVDFGYSLNVSTAPIDIEEFLTSIDFENLILTLDEDSKPISSDNYLPGLGIEIYNATASTTAAPDLLSDYFAGVAAL